MIHIRENVLLAPFTVYSIGGPARYFAEARTGKEIREAVAFGRDKGAPFFILGAGSNVLVSDKGFPGIVIRVVGGEISVLGETIRADAGVKMAALVAAAAHASLTGFEWGIGIPGSVGGSVRGNAGCFGSEMKNVIEKVSIFNFSRRKVGIPTSVFKNKDKASGQFSKTKELRNSGKSDFPGKSDFQTLNNSDCEFGYRDSIFKAHPEWIILSATLSLKKGDSDLIRKRIVSFTRERTEKQDIGTKSCGCIFKNAAWDASGGKEFLLRRFPELSKIADRPNIPAAFLIDQVGLKGERAGNIVISSKHANFFVNKGGASAQDVRRLICRAEDRVRQKYEIELDPEIQYVGFEEN